MENYTVKRLASIDVFRALTMFFMLFVNDIPGLSNIPHWLLHARYDEDMLGFSDVIFPSFLFVMGMSIPFAILKRMEKGDSISKVLWHIGERTLALLVMGLFTVNLESYDGEAAGLPHPYFAMIMVVAFFMIWNLYPKAENWKKYLYLGLKIMGVVLLLGLFFIYKGSDGTTFEPRWWGILGLIGWTYLVAAIVFLVTRIRLWAVIVAWLLFLTLSVLAHADVFHLPFVPSEMTLHALGVSGVFTSVLLIHFGNKENPYKFIGICCGLALLMLILSFVVHPFWIFSKIQATPTWLFACNAIAFFLVALLYGLTDVCDHTKWFNVVRPAGTVTLTCYIIPYFWYSAQSVLGWEYPDFFSGGIPGLFKSLVYSLAVVWLAGGLLKLHIRLKI